MAWIWVTLALLAMAAMWASAVARAREESTRTLSTALRDAGTYAQAYEQYISRSVMQLDQMARQLAQTWEVTHGEVRIEDLAKQGMFLDSEFVSVRIIDRRGRVVSAIHGATGQDVAHTAYFQFHKNNNSSALRITGLPAATSGQLATALFTLRLETEDDAFDGLVTLEIRGSHFTSFYLPDELGRMPSVAMLVPETGMRLEQPGALAGNLGHSPFPGLASLEPAAQGVRVIEWPGHVTPSASLLGWKKSHSFPLVAMVALSQQSVQTMNEQYWIGLRNSVAWASAGLLVLAILATLLALRSEQRAVDLESRRQAYRLATESANDGFYLVTAVRDRRGQVIDFKLIDCNERGAFFYGSTREALVGSRLSRLEPAVFGAGLLDTYKQAMASGFYEDERKIEGHGQLNITWAKRRLVSVGDGLAVTLQDVSERRRHEEQLVRLAREDALTTLPNRYWLTDNMPRMLDEAAGRGTTLALLFIDLDEFKAVNDLHGHTVGDQILHAAALRLKAVLRPEDHIVRFGGDEFIVLLQGPQDDRQISCVAERILATMSAPFHAADSHLNLGASIGVSVYPRDGESAVDLIRHADIAMFAGKHDGKSTCRFFHHALADAVNRKQQLKQDLADAIGSTQLFLVYQPRVRADTGQLCSMEALLRWQHPIEGMIAPVEFIPIAETSGLIVEIGARVIDMACAQMARWRSSGIDTVPVSINVSALQFDGSMPGKLAAALHRYALPAHLLEVEVTESAMLGNQAVILNELAGIRALGIKLHVDDFGTGYSSLAQLQNLKMDVLKVDRAFTNELGKSNESTVFFQAIVSMAHALGMEVVAEGVETAAQMAILRELACNEVQGYYISRPIEADPMGQLQRGRAVFPAPAPLLRAVQ